MAYYMNKNVPAKRGDMAIKTRPSTSSHRTSRMTTTILLMKSENGTLQATSRNDFLTEALTRARATKRLSLTLQLSDYQPSDFATSDFRL